MAICILNCPDCLMERVAIVPLNKRVCPKCGYRAEERKTVTLTKEQERVLLHKHLTGDWPGQKWATIEALFRKELIEGDETGKRIVLTARGKAYCDAHHKEMPWADYDAMTDGDIKAYKFGKRWLKAAQRGYDKIKAMERTGKPRGAPMAKGTDTRRANMNGEGSTNG